VTKIEIEKLLDDLGVPFAIVAKISTGDIQRFGDPSSIQPAGLIDDLFGDAEAVRNLSDSFEEQLKPQSMQQGEVAAVLCTPKDDVIVGLFCRTTLGPVDYYHWTKRLCEAVDSAWE
jgi:hypothetical protein